MLTLPDPPALTLAPAPELRVQKEKQDKKETEKDEKKPRRRRWHRDESDSNRDDNKDDEGEDGGKPAITLLTGTYDPRGPQLGSLRQYTLSSQGLFLDYLKGGSATKAEVIGVGVNGGAFVERRPNAAVSPFLNWGWGVYHARGSSSETKLAWRLGMGVTTKVGFLAKLQLLDTRLKNGDLRGSSLMFGWRF